MYDLVNELRALDYWSPGMQVLLDEAMTGEYHDYKNQKYDCGKIEVVKKLEAEAALPRTPRLTREKLKAIAQDVRQGVYDEEPDEADKAELRKTIPRAAWEQFGL